MDYSGASFSDADDEMWYSNTTPAFYSDNSIVPSPSHPLLYSSNTGFTRSSGSDSLFTFSDPLSMPTGLVPGNGSYGSPGGISLMDIRQPRQQTSFSAGPLSRLLFCSEPDCKNRTGFRRQSDLTRHQKTHGKPYPCDECDYKFGSKADATRHRREVHLKDENNARPSLHFCPVCSCKRSRRGFGRLWNMQTHVRKAHPHVRVPDGDSTAGSPRALPPLDTPSTFTSSLESEPPTPTPLFDVPENSAALDGNGALMLRQLQVHGEVPHEQQEPTMIQTVGDEESQTTPESSLLQAVRHADLDIGKSQFEDLAELHQLYQLWKRQRQQEQIMNADIEQLRAEERLKRLEEQAKRTEWVQETEQLLRAQQLNELTREHELTGNTQNRELQTNFQHISAGETEGMHFEAIPRQAELSSAAQGLPSIRASNGKMRSNEQAGATTVDERGYDVFAAGKLAQEGALLGLAKRAYGINAGYNNGRRTRVEQEQEALPNFAEASPDSDSVSYGQMTNHDLERSMFNLHEPTDQLRTKSPEQLSPGGQVRGFRRLIIHTDRLPEDVDRETSGLEVFSSDTAESICSITRALFNLSDGEISFEDIDGNTWDATPYHLPRTSEIYIKYRPSADPIPCVEEKKQPLSLSNESTTTSHQLQDEDDLQSLPSLTDGSTVSTTLSGVVEERDAADQIVSLLREDEHVNLWLSEALGKIGAQRFDRKAMRLLKAFSDDLKEEANDNLEAATAHLLRRRSPYIVHCLRQLFGPDSQEIVAYKAMDDLQAQMPEKQQRLDEFLRKVLESRSRFGSFDQRNEQVQQYLLSGVQEVEELDLSEVSLFPNIERAKAFLRGSTAYQTFQVKLKEFASKSTVVETHGEPSQEQPSGEQILCMEPDQATLDTDCHAECSDEQRGDEENFNSNLKQADYEWIKNLAVSLKLSSIPLTPRALWNQLQRLLFPAIPLGYTRVEWICSCGDVLYVDFDRADVESIRVFKDTKNGESIRAVSSARKDSVNADGSACSNMDDTTSESSSKNTDNDDEAESDLESGSSNTSYDIDSASQTSRPQEDPDRYWLEVCINRDSKFSLARHIVLEELSLSQIACDKQLFPALKAAYEATRYRRWHHRVLISQRRVEFVQFQLWNKTRGYVSTREPPNRQVPDANDERYYYQQRGSNPPEISHAFLHYMAHSEQDLSELGSSAWLGILPRRRGEPFFKNARNLDTGFGIRITDGLNTAFIVAIYLLLVGVAVITGVVWAGVKGDVQGGMGIISAAISVPPIGTGVYLLCGELERRGLV